MLDEVHASRARLQVLDEAASISKARSQVLDKIHFTRLDHRCSTKLTESCLVMTRKGVVVLEALVVVASAVMVR